MEIGPTQPTPFDRVLPSSPHLTLQDWLGIESGKSAHITVLFTDIVGSTKLAKLIGDDKWAEQLKEHFDLGSAFLAQKRGYKIKFIGDAFMAAFKNPMDALEFATEFHKKPGHPSIRIRVCIHSGVGRVIDNDLFGTMVNYAARIVNWKKDDGIVISEQAHYALKSHYGEQRGKELFIRINGVRLRDFRRRPLYTVNTEEWWAVGIRESVPDVSEVLSARCATGCLIRPVTVEEIDWIADLEKRSYGLKLGVPHKILHDWYRANPNGFSVLCRNDGEMIGHLDILPLTPAGEDLLLRGQETEQAIAPDMIYSPAEQDKTESFYVESIVVKDKYKDLKPRALYCILSNFAPLVNRVCKTQGNKRIYGLGGTPSGERLMRQLGFHMIGRADDRVDGYPLYVANYCDIQHRITTILDGAIAK